MGSAASISLLLRGGRNIDIDALGGDLNATIERLGTGGHPHDENEALLQQYIEMLFRERDGIVDDIVDTVLVRVQRDLVVGQKILADIRAPTDTPAQTPVNTASTPAAGSIRAGTNIVDTYVDPRPIVARPRPGIEVRNTWMSMKAPARAVPTPATVSSTPATVSSTPATVSSTPAHAAQSPVIGSVTFDELFP